MIAGLIELLMKLLVVGAAVYFIADGQTEKAIFFVLVVLVVAIGEAADSVVKAIREAARR